MQRDQRSGARTLEWNELTALGVLSFLWGMGPSLLKYDDLLRPASDQPYVFGWGQMLRSLPLSRFYETNMGTYVRFPHPNPLNVIFGRPDHLPTDIGALKLLELIYTALGGSGFTSGWFLLFAALQVASAVAAAFGLYVLAIRLFGRGHGENAILLVALLSPLVPLAAYMQRWDYFSADLAVLTLVSLSLALERARWWPVVGILASMTALSKPQYGLVLAPITVWLVLRTRAASDARDARGRRLAVGIGAAALGAVVTTAGALALFRMSPRDLIALTHYAGSKFPFTTAAAGNLWQIIDPQRQIPTAGDGYWWTVVPDSRAFAGVSYQHWGWVVFTVLAAYAVLIAWRWRAPVTHRVLWATTVVYVSYWWATTRQNEKFLLPALLVALLFLASVWSGATRGRWLVLVGCLWVAATLQVLAANGAASSLVWTAWALSAVLAALMIAPLIGTRREPEGVRP